MIVNTQKFFDDYKKALFDRDEIIESRENKINADVETVKRYIFERNLPESILPDFIEKVRQAREEEFSTSEIDTKIDFYETYIENELEPVIEEKLF